MPHLEVESGLSNKPVVVVLLEFDEFFIGERGDIRERGCFVSLWGDAVDPSTVGKVDGIPTNVGVVPVKDVDTTIGTGFDRESDPCKVVGGDEIISMGGDER